MPPKDIQQAPGSGQSRRTLRHLRNAGEPEIHDREDTTIQRGHEFASGGLAPRYVHLSQRGYWHLSSQNSLNDRRDLAVAPATEWDNFAVSSDCPPRVVDSVPRGGNPAATHADLIDDGAARPRDPDTDGLTQQRKVALSRDRSHPQSQRLAPSRRRAE